jgi:hypothetical protein
VREGGIGIALCGNVVGWGEARIEQSFQCVSEVCPEKVFLVVSARPRSVLDQLLS